MGRRLLGRTLVCLLGLASASAEAEQGEALARANSDHWAFQPVVRPSVPAVEHSAWLRNPIDAFVLARLEREGLKPSPEADRVTLIRRLSLDLLGLPPSIAEVERFLADTQPDAYQRLLDRLFSSPHYGERWARHWLDLARYADSNGYTIDSARSIWKYRDWVIQAFNQNLPFDRFTIEQIAGDMLPGATTDQIVATGLHRNTLINEEGGTDKEQFRVESVVDRVSTTGTVFLGLTVGCAQCHDHKYDPISQREYYQLFSFFNNADEPKLQLPNEQQGRQLTALKDQIAQAEKRLWDYDAQQLARQAQWERELNPAREVTWTVLDRLQFRSASGTEVRKLLDGSLLVAGSIPPNDTYTVVADVLLAVVTAVRLEVLTHDSLPNGGPGLATNGNFVLSEFSLAANPVSGDGPESSERVPLVLDRALADHSQKNWPVEYAVDGNLNTGWAINVARGRLNVNRTATFITKEEAVLGPNGRLTFTLQHQHSGARYSIGRFRLSVTGAPRTAVEIPDAIREILRVPKDQRSRKQQEDLAAEFGKGDKERRALVARLEKLKKRHQDVSRSIATTMVIRERRSPRQTHVHIRGDFLRKGAGVRPDVPAVLPPLPPDLRSPTRLDLARWLVDSRNPLTARVSVNHFWQRFFGLGLVETENDFGTRGEKPSHPELLDWLASEFIARGWSVKEIHRLIVSSATYRQSSQARPDLARIDPRNRLLARQGRLRLEAETIRDMALAASGFLTPKIGGPSVYPPQPSGIYRFTQKVKPWKDSQGPERYRRGMYTFFWRSRPYPFLTTFDAPDANTSCTRRARSNTPLQALTLANDPAFFEIAQRLATRVLRETSGDDAERVGYAFRLCLSRPPTDREIAVLTQFLNTQLRQFQAATEEAAAAAPEVRPQGIGTAQAAAWTALARVLLNLDEFITRG